MKIFLLNFFSNNVHIGHNAINSLLLSSWFFYKLKKKIWIINIFKTIIFLKITFKFITYLVNYKLPFWFINLEKTKEVIFKKFGNISGEFFCGKIWIRGLLSNFKCIQKTLSKYILNKNLIKKEKKNNLVKYWILTRFTWPRSIFLSNIIYNYIVCKEAGNILLPIVAMVDTNIKSFLFNFPIPSNDDSIYSIIFIIGIISKKILLIKYKRLILWYTYYRIKKYKNLVNLLELIKKVNFVKLASKKFSKINIINTLSKFKRSIRLLFKEKTFLSKNLYNLNNYFYDKWLNRSLIFFKRLSFIYVYHKKTLNKFKFLYSKKYKSLLKNFIKFFSYKKFIKKFSKRKNLKRKKLFKKYLSLNFFYLKKTFSFTNKVYDIYFDRKFVNLAFVLNIYRWLSLFQRYIINRYRKRNFLHYWLFPNIVSFYIKESKKKWKWFHSKHYRPVEKSFFSIYLRFFYKRKIFLIEPTLLKFYNSWFFFLFKKK